MLMNTSYSFKVLMNLTFLRAYVRIIIRVNVGTTAQRFQRVSRRKQGLNHVILSS